jgi:hypothetical protein
VFAGTVLFSALLNLYPPIGTTINWLIGNSYTSAIDVQKLANLLVNSELIFYPLVYVFPPGSTAYQVYNTNPDFQGPQAIDLTDIPAMSIFMIRLDGTVPQQGMFSIGKDITTHGSLGHNLRSTSQYDREILFRVTPEDNDNIFDLAAIGIRPNVNTVFNDQDIAKVFMIGNDAFQLYTLSEDNVKLSSNAVPPGTQTVRLCLAPGHTAGRLKLRAARQESLNNVWIEDLLMRRTVNLKETAEYVFDSDPQDVAERFIVHFSKAPTGSDNLTDDNFLQCYYLNKQLVIKGLEPKDLNAEIAVVNMQGQLMKRTTINQTPEARIPITLPTGVYIAKLTGYRNVTVKFRSN